MITFKLKTFWRPKLSNVEPSQYLKRRPLTPFFSIDWHLKNSFAIPFDTLGHFVIEPNNRKKIIAECEEDQQDSASC